jgi:hypothetical protein
MDVHLSPGGYRACGATAGAIGLAASGVATWLAVLGLLELECDAAAREALIAAGVLLTVGQLTAFGFAGLLPARAMRSLRAVLLALGAALFAAEVAMVAITQLALVKTADRVEDAAAARIGELQRTIQARRATAAGQRELAATQQQAQAITAAARSLRAAEAAESAIEPLAGELRTLQVARRPTLSDLLGADNTAVYATVRAALIGLVGLVFMSAAGTLFRAARGVQAPAQAAEQPTSEPARQSGHQARRPHFLETSPMATGQMPPTRTPNAPPTALTELAVPQPAPQSRSQWPLPQRTARGKSRRDSG